MRMTIMFFLMTLLIRRNYIIFNVCNFLVDADQNATFSLLTYSRLTQFSCTKSGNFTQFLYTEIGNVHDNFMFFIEWRYFYTKIGQFSGDFMTWTRYAIFIGWMFSIFREPYENMDSTNQHSTLSLARNNKNPKIAKNWHAQNSAMAALWCLIVPDRFCLWEIQVIVLEEIQVQQSYVT